MKPLIYGGWAPPIEWFIDINGVAVRMKPLIYGGWAPPIEWFIK